MKKTKMKKILSQNENTKKNKYEENPEPKKNMKNTNMKKTLS